MRYHARNIFSHVNFATCLQIAVVDLDGGQLFQKLIVREGTDGLKQLTDIISPPLTINFLNMLVLHILVNFSHLHSCQLL